MAFTFTIQPSRIAQKIGPVQRIPPALRANLPRLPGSPVVTLFDAPPPVVVTPPPPTNTISSIKPQKPEGSFRRGTPTKGYFINMATREKITFMFNPHEVDFGDGWKWATADIPGASNPLEAGGSGDVRPIVFTLYFDADRGRMSARQRVSGKSEDDLALSSEPLAQDDPASWDLTLELNRYRKLTMPVQSPSAQTTTLRSSPPKVLLRLGTFFPGVLCTVRHLDGKLLGFTNKLEPRRAQLTVTLTRWANKSFNSNNFADPTSDDGT